MALGQRKVKMYNIIMNKVKNYCHYLLESSVQKTLDKNNCVISIVIPWFKFKTEGFWNELSQLCSELNKGNQEFVLCLPTTYCPKLSNHEGCFDYYDFINRSSIDEFNFFLSAWSDFQKKVKGVTQIWECSFSFEGKYAFLDLNKKTIQIHKMFLDYYRESAKEKLGDVLVYKVFYSLNESGDKNNFIWELNEFEERNGYLIDRRVVSVPLMIKSETIGKRDLMARADMNGVHLELKNNYSFQYVFSDFFSLENMNAEIQICLDNFLSEQSWNICVQDFLAGKTLIFFDSILADVNKNILDNVINERGCKVEEFSYFAKITHVFLGEGSIIIINESDFNVLTAAEKSQFWNKFFTSLNSNLIPIKCSGDWDGDLIKFKTKTDTFSIKEKTILNLVPKTNSGDVELNLKDNHVFLTSNLNFDQIRVNKHKINVSNTQQSFYIELGFS